jgi:hypothetical protein
MSRAARIAAIAASLVYVRPAAAQSLIMTGGFGMPTAPVEYQGPDAVHVHIQGNGTLLQESTNGWQTVCLIPCSTRVSPEGTYKLGGFMDKDSHPFQFPAGPSLELWAHTASSFDFGHAITGWTLVGLAPAPLVLGGLLFTGAFESGNAPSTTDRIGGGIAVAGGAALLAFGIYLLSLTPKTTLTTANGDRLARAPSFLMSGVLALTPAGAAF